MIVGIGYAMLMVSLLVSIYYNVIMAWIIFYLFASFTKEVPWKKCNPAWASENCREDYLSSGNGSVFNATSNVTSCMQGFSAVYKNITRTAMTNVSVVSNCIANPDVIRVSPPNDYFK